MKGIRPRGLRSNLETALGSCRSQCWRVHGRKASFVRGVVLRGGKARPLDAGDVALPWGMDGPQIAVSHTLVCSLVIAIHNGDRWFGHAKRRLRDA